MFDCEILPAISLLKYQCSNLWHCQDLDTLEGVVLQLIGKDRKSLWCQHYCYVVVNVYICISRDVLTNFDNTGVEW